jgi:hypothetical protein
MANAWHTHTVGGYAVRLSLPPGSAVAGRVLMLQPFDPQSDYFAQAFTQHLHAHRLACCVPEPVDPFWLDRPVAAFAHAEGHTPLQYLRQVVVPWLIEAVPLATASATASETVGLLGVSLGGQAVLRLAFRYAEQFPVVAALAAVTDFHELYGQGTLLDAVYPDREACRRDTPSLAIRAGQTPHSLFLAADPEDASWYDGNALLHEKLLAMGVAHEAQLSQTASGDTRAYLQQLAPTAIAFLADALRRQALRLL